jgi:hypothetical protein
MKRVNDVSICKQPKHILAKLNYAKDLVDSDIAVIIYLNTHDMSANNLSEYRSYNLSEYRSYNLSQL